MRYCTNCGTPLNDDATNCPNCGAPATGEQPENNGFSISAAPAAPAPAAPKKASGLVTAAFVLMILGCLTTVGMALTNMPQQGVLGFILGLIPLVWQIPMTCLAAVKRASGERFSTGFKVCTLLFVSLIGGICLLCEKEQ